MYLSHKGTDYYRTIIYAFSFQVFNSKRTSGRHNVVDLWIPMQTSVLTRRGIWVLIIVIYWSLSAPFMLYFWTVVTLFLICTFYYLCKIENYTKYNLYDKMRIMYGCIKLMPFIKLFIMRNKHHESTTSLALTLIL